MSRAHENKLFIINVEVYNLCLIPITAGLFIYSIPIIEKIINVPRR